MSKHIHGDRFVSGRQSIPLDAILCAKVTWDGLTTTPLYLCLSAVIASLLLFLKWGNNWTLYALLLSSMVTYLMSTKLQIQVATLANGIPGVGIYQFRGGISYNYTKLRAIKRALTATLATQTPHMAHPR